MRGYVAQTKPKRTNACKDELMTNPNQTLKDIKNYINLIQSEDPIRVQSLIDLEQKIDDLVRWINRGGFIPEGLDDNR